jgi:glycosyltransferase involved in cell wall biosynthesis
MDQILNSNQGLQNDALKTNIPCVIFAYNRPDKLKRLLKALELQGIEKLIVFIDGAKNVSDIGSVNACKRLVDEIKWVKTEHHYNEKNCGLIGLINNISLVFREYHTAIFLEDDCIPSPGFYSLLSQALEHYSSCKKVFSIGGYQPIAYNFFKDYPFSFVSCARFTCWGWGTWKDRWQLVLEDLPYFSDLLGRKKVSEFVGFDLALIAKRMRSNILQDNSWATKVALLSYWRKLVHLLPVEGKIKNIGFDLHGSNVGRLSAILGSIYHNKNISQNIKEPVWLRDIEINCMYNMELAAFTRKVHSSTIRNEIRRISSMLRRSIQPKNNAVLDVTFKKSSNNQYRKRVLLSYIVHPILIPEQDPRMFGHINIWHTREIVKILNRQGYLVDVVDYRDKNYKINRNYDLFIGHGGINFVQLTRQLKNDVPKVFLATGSYWKFHNEQEIQRFDDLARRRGQKLGYDRLITSDEETALSLADGILGFGNKFTLDTYAKYPHVYMVDGNAVYDDHAEWCNKDFDFGRKNFLFFSGRGNIHKGLDLLIEAFSHLDIHLWICTKIETQFYRLYSKELSNSENIHLVGWVLPRTKKYYEIVQKCNYAILPSCSEGQSQSIIECMWQGLIPVVSRNCGIDLDEFGYYIDPCTIDSIEDLVTKLSALPIRECKEASTQVRETALNRYSEENFTANLIAALTLLVGENQKDEYT